MVYPGSQISVLVGCNHGVSKQSDQYVGGLQSWSVESVSQISVLVGCNPGV